MKKCHPRKNFSPEEDYTLALLVNQYGDSNWHLIAALMPNRNVRQCRERWVKYLNPSLRTEEWTSDEDRLLIQKRQEMGPKWKDISKFFNGRTDINIKNRYKVLKRKSIRLESILNNNHIFSQLKLETETDDQNTSSENDPIVLEQHDDSQVFDSLEDPFFDSFDSFNSFDEFI